MQNTPPIIILVEPEQPRNVGSVLRCAANFGLTEIRVVRAQPFSPDDTNEIAIASAGAHSLVSIQHHATLDNALGQCDFIIGTSGRTRSGNTPTATRLVQLPLGTAASVAIVFGRESQGLTSHEIRHCHALLHLPVSPQFPSLNLSHAVALTLFDWFHCTRQDTSLPHPANSTHPASATAPRDLQERWLADLPPQRPEATAQLRRLLQRAQPTAEDMALLFNLVRQLRRNDQE